MNLRVFSDDDGKLHAEISSPVLKYRWKLFVPLVETSSSRLKDIDPKTLVHVWYNDREYHVPYLLVHSQDMRLKDWKHVGILEENNSRDILNNILDVLAWDP